MLARQIDDTDAVRELALRASTALGVATEADIRDYFRLRADQVKPALAWLLKAGSWSASRFRVGPRQPICALARRSHGRIGGRRCCVPSTRWSSFAPRVERLFGFEYRIEIYTPQPNVGSGTTSGRSSWTESWWAGSTSRLTGRQER